VPFFLNNEALFPNNEPFSQNYEATEDAFQELEREQQENIIVWLRDEGASVRQIVSHTGFTTKQVRNLTDKDKKKQAD
jgi:hypothetical protein